MQIQEKNQKLNLVINCLKQCPPVHSCEDIEEKNYNTKKKKYMDVPAKQVRKAINFSSWDMAVHTPLFIILSCLLVSWICILVLGQRRPDFMCFRLLLL